MLIPLSLRAKLLLFGMALQLGVLAVLALSIPMMVEPHFRAEQAADTQRFKSMVSAALALAIASGDDASVTAVLQHSRADQDLVYIAVYGTNGQLIAGDAAPSPEAAKAGPFEAVSSAISLDGLALGELRFALSGSELGRVHQAFLRGLAWLGLLILALFSPLLWWASASLSRPVQALLTASRDIRAGNYDIDVKPGSADDIGALQASFIRMSAEIRRKVNELTRSEALQRRYLRQALDQRGELVNALQRAEAASTVKTEFLAHVSHEIRTPLNAILGFSQLLQSAPLQGQHRDYLGSLEVAGQTLLDAINDLLDYAKLEDSTLVLVHQPFVLTELLKDLDRQFGAQARAKGLLLHTRLGTGLPPGFVGDAQRLRQILAILVGNAIKFTEFGEVLIDATCAEPSSATVSLKISVRDT
ncbi:MAG: HAMP domain-containing protein, partial [Burkholderiales bacterium]|nr:HAMP domain-containing protein [Burkholderiales bacterium]